MTAWRIKEAAPGHIPAIAENMRDADRREVWASSRKTPREALETSLDFSDMAWTCFIEGVPAFMWGAGRKGSILPETGVPWLLGTDGILEVKREFLKQSRAYVERMQERFPRLENKVHAGNALSIRWLRWCGFVLGDAPELINGEEFFLFWREAYAV